jgi:hypothetical protein
MATRQLPLIGGHPEGFGATTRKDAWWAGPLATSIGLSLFVVYTTWAAFQGEHYFADPYLSPFYSPLLFIKADVAGGAPGGHAWVGDWPGWLPSLVPASPAIFILVFPGAFRFTCYYYRKAYYRAFAGSPPACAVGPLAQKRSYKGETALLIFQNLHRFALYFAIIFVFILSYDAIIAFSRNGQLGVGVGSIVLTLNAILIGAYTFGCHSFRHLIGGRDDCMSCGKSTLKYGLWKRASWLNGHHMLFAWLSLIWVMVSDLYVRLVSMGVIKDLNTWS